MKKEKEIHNRLRIYGTGDVGSKWQGKWNIKHILSHRSLI